MQKFLKTIVIYLSALLVMLTLYLWLVSEYVPTHFKHQRIALELKQTQVLVTGSSHTLMGVNPKNLQLPSANIAEINKPIIVDLKLVKKYHQLMPNLLYVVVPIDYFTLFFDGESEHYNKRYWHHWGLEKERISKFHFMDCYIATPYDLLTEKREPLSNYSIQTGNWSRFSERVKTKFAQKRTGIWHKNWMDEKAAVGITKEIQFFVEFCKKNDIQIILIEMPVPLKIQTFYETKYTSKTRDVIKHLVLQSNVTHLNFNDSLVFKNDSLFADADHLNQKGAVILSKMLNNALEKLNTSLQVPKKEIREPERF